MSGNSVSPNSLKFMMPHTDPGKNPKRQISSMRDQYAGLTTNTLLTTAVNSSLKISNKTANSSTPTPKSLSRDLSDKLATNDPEANHAMALGEAIALFEKSMPSEGTRCTIEEFLREFAPQQNHTNQVTTSASANQPSADALREERLPEILIQAQGIQIFFEALLGLSEHTHARVLSLLEILASACELPTYRLKVILDMARPAQLDPQINPLILTPSHGSCPSGHATQAYLFAHVLVALSGGTLASISDPSADGHPLYKLAARIAENRVIAGVHFEQDSMVGRILGIHCANKLIATMKKRGSKNEPSVLSMLWAGAQFELSRKTGSEAAAAEAK